MLKKLSKTTLRNKILFSYLGLIIFVVVFAYVIFFLKTSEILLTHAKSSTWNGINQAAEFINYKLSGSKDTSSIIYLDDEFGTLVNQFTKEEEDFSKYTVYNQLTKKLTAVSMGRDNYSVRLYVNGSTITPNYSSKIKDLSEIENEIWYEEFVEERGSIIWIPTYDYDYGYPMGKQTIVSLARDVYQNGRRYGVVVVDILERTIFDILKEVSLTKKGSVTIVDSNGLIISSIDREIIGGSYTEQHLLPEIISSIKGEIKVDVDKTSSMMFYRKIPNTDWNLVVTIPMSEIIQETTSLTQFMIMILVIIVIITSFISLKISNNVTHRLEKLSKNMLRIQNDEWDIDKTVDSGDEIGDLQRSFAYMVENMQILINDKYQSEIDIKQAELRALQAQINPHFLYNILDMINWMAMKHGADDINYIVAKLAKFFRLSLQSGKEMVRVEDEIEHIMLYIDIQNKRFKNDIKTIINIDETILPYQTIKLILQPLIENAIIHGIMESKLKSGVVKITGYLEGKDIIIDIEDDGIGMSQNLIDSILNTSVNGSYGVRNVNERIKLKFGPQYGLVYESEIDKGTRVRVSFPAIKTG